MISIAHYTQHNDDMIKLLQVEGISKVTIQPEFESDSLDNDINCNAQVFTSESYNNLCNTLESSNDAKCKCY